MATPLNRQKAATRARLAQGALGVLLVGGGVAMGVGLHAGASVELPAELVIPPFDIPKTAAAKPAVVDVAGLTDRLGLVSNAPKAVEVVAAAPDDGKKPAGAAPPPPPQAGELRYLGAVGMGSMKMALVNDGGRQRFVTVGDQLAGGTVESVTDALIKIGGNSPQTLELAARGSEVLTKAHRLAAAPGGVPGGAPARPGQPQGLAVVKPGNGLPGVTGEGTGIPDYIHPDQARRFEEIRNDLRAKQAFGSEQEVNEFAAKLLQQQDPNAVDQGGLNRQPALQGDPTKGAKAPPPSKKGKS